jgi:hypothetical protein
MTRPALHQLSCRLPSSFAQYFKDNLFNDLILTTATHRYRCSRLILARHCGWFYRTLRDLPAASLDEPTTIRLPIDPHDRFQDFLDVVATGRTDISSETIVPLLKIATFYESPDLTKIFRHFVDRVVTDETVLSVVADFLKFELVGDVVRLAPRLAPLTHQLIRGDPDSQFTREQLFGSVPPAVLAGILGDPVMGDLTSDEKVAFIDDYVAANGVPGDADCQLLAALVDWNPTILGNYRLFARNRCDWVPPTSLFRSSRSCWGRAAAS